MYAYFPITNAYVNYVVLVQMIIYEGLCIMKSALKNELVVRNMSLINCFSYSTQITEKVRGHKDVADALKGAFTPTKLSRNRVLRQCFVRLNYFPA